MHDGEARRQRAHSSERRPSRPQGSHRCGDGHLHTSVSDPVAAMGDLIIRPLPPPCAPEYPKTNFICNKCEEIVNTVNSQ